MNNLVLLGCNGSDDHIGHLDSPDVLRCDRLYRAHAIRSGIIGLVGGRTKLIAHLALWHIEHMAAWIAARRASYSFEALNEDMPALRAALDSQIATVPLKADGARK